MYAIYLHKLPDVTHVTQHTPSLFARYAVQFKDGAEGVFVFVPAKIVGRLLSLAEKSRPVVYIAVPRTDTELLQYRIRTGAAFVQHWAR